MCVCVGVVLICVYVCVRVCVGERVWVCWWWWCVCVCVPMMSTNNTTITARGGGPRSAAGQQHHQGGVRMGGWDKVPPKRFEKQESKRMPMSVLTALACLHKT